MMILGVKRNWGVLAGTSFEWVRFGLWVRCETTKKMGSGWA